MLTADNPKPKWRGYTFVQLQRCAARELMLRQRVYPNRVLTHRMTADKAAQEVDMMRVIAEVMAELAEGERLL